MTDSPIREPDQIRQDAARKLRAVQVSTHFQAILGCLLGEGWTTPRLVEMVITPDGHVLGRPEGEPSFKAFVGSSDDLLRNLHGVAPVAELDGDEVGYLIEIKEAEVVQYRYARRSDGTMADAQELTGRPSDQEFNCIGCDNKLIAKVNGAKRQPHFSHHPGTTCSPETYLHRLGKQVFVEVYRECLAAGEPFEIELLHPLVCRRFEESLGTVCVQKQSERKSYDLTSYYDRVLVEKRDGEFIPDVTLTDSAHSERSKVYIEIAVTHFLSEKKEATSERVIEIPLRSEADLSRIHSRKLSPETARFVNFATESQSLVDSDCSCIERRAKAFIVLNTGRCRLETGTLAAVESERLRKTKQIAYFRLMNDSGQPSDETCFLSASAAFRKAVVQARDDGFPLKNCYLCCYHGDNFGGDPGLPIYCKCFKTKCNSNEAVTCRAFRPS